MKQSPEKVNTGGLTGQGFSNLLGRPKLGAMPLVIREAVQNSWDARWRRGPRSLLFSVRVRNLNAGEEKLFRKIFDQADAIEPKKLNQLGKLLRDEAPVRVLELSDFGTVGLCGSTRPDLPMGDVPSRFVNFFFDVGRSHEESGDGGTYGFGRSSLYTSGKASLILVDSLVDASGGTERRLMACRIGEAFEVSTGWTKGRYSGRHFWGKETSSIIQPLTGNEAERVSEKLGLPARDSLAHTGTTVLIPWPSDDFEDGREIARTILHHLWPKMVEAPGYAPIRFSVEVDGVKFPVADPAKVDEYRLFVRALKLARSQNEGAGARIIETLRPRHVTGCLGVVVGTLAASVRRSTPVADDDEATDGIESPLNAIALMRPSELVVRYLPVAGTELSDRNWAGVFISGDTPFVRTSFARSEPPAHDDWIADRTADKHGRYVVRKTVQSLLPDAVRELLGIGTVLPGADAEGGASLAGVSSRFSAAFLSGDGQGPAIEHWGAGSGGKPRGVSEPSLRRTRVGSPEPVGLAAKGAVRLATFAIPLTGPVGTSVRIRAFPSVHAEGALEGVPAGITPPTIAAWRGGAAIGTVCEVTLNEPQTTVEVDVAFHGDYGVALDCELEREGAG